jgi:hypothetical protein
MWPDGRTFAFTIFDDTDWTTMRNGPPIYNFLHELGFRTTKSVWPLEGEAVPAIGGDTCGNPRYLEWVRGLQDQGFEIGLHNVMYHTATRNEVLEGFARFKDYFGHSPATHANHAGCNDSIYWGEDRLTGPNKIIYNFLTRYGNHNLFQGHVKGSNLYWGDLCEKAIKYVRNFTYFDINTLKVCPMMPYFDTARPQVNYWFASSEGAGVDSFNERISEKNQDRLEAEGGLCIMYTHFANGFIKEGRLNSRFVELMTRLSQKNGWFVPVSTILDYLLKIRGSRTISSKERYRLEFKWLLERVRNGGST